MICSSNYTVKHLFFDYNTLKVKKNRKIISKHEKNNK